MTLLEQLRTLYFAVSQATIDDDFLKAIALFKQLTSDEEREKAAVFMEGIAEMRQEWGGAKSDAANRHRGGGRRPGGKRPPGGRR